MFFLICDKAVLINGAVFIFVVMTEQTCDWLPPFLNIYATEDNIIPNSSTTAISKVIGSKDKSEHAFLFALTL